MSRQVPKLLTKKVRNDVRIGIVAARFNAKVVDTLLDGCLRRLKQSGLSEKRVVVERVPGAFEIPLAAKAMARTRRFAAIICLGAVIRGETPHFDFVAGECARGVAEVSRSEMLPLIFGVLTTNNEQQAWDRCGGSHGHAGQQAADAAIEMIALLSRLHAD